ncbi:DUF1566 domain-containing protein [bacterium]|nr:DUF1566 domain-containing protein [bacterium]
MKHRQFILLLVFATFFISCEKKMDWINTNDSNADSARIEKICRENKIECGVVNISIDGSFGELDCGKCQDGFNCSDENKCEKTDSDDTGSNNDDEKPVSDDADSGDSVPDNDSDSTDTTSDNSDSASDNDADSDSGDSTPDNDTTPANPCNPNPCSSVANSNGNCMASGSTNYSCGCKTHYSWNSSSKTCVADTQTVDCTGLPATGALWNTVSSITQTWNGSDWEPSSVATHNDEASTQECRYKCIENYTYENSQCVSAKRIICTGQNKCYNSYEEMPCPNSYSESFFGQDAQYTSKCTAQSFSSSSNVIIDNNTGLIWQRNLPLTYEGCSGDYGLCSYNEAIQYCNKLIYAGYDDWRLPTPQELLTTVDNSRYSPAIDTTYFPMPNTTAKPFWSALILSDNTDQAWSIDFASGNINNSIENLSYYVRCVRGNSLSNSTFESTTVNGDIIVTDSETGLIWQETSQSEKTWKEALDYCEKLNYAGFTDWRLPNKNELASLVNYAIYNPASNFTNMPSQSFWSSSTYVGSTSSAWLVGFLNGHVSYSGKTYMNYVRCVRNAD